MGLTRRSPKGVVALTGGQILDRLVEQSFNQPVLCNVERGMYVEYMVEHTLRTSDPAWRMTGTWDGWDLEYGERGPRVEVKQSGALVKWGPKAPIVSSKGSPRFNIEPHGRYWETSPLGQTETIESRSPRRHADVYVFAWHGVTDRDEVDQRDPTQWQFYVVPEHRLPPGQKTISLNPLAALGHASSYAELAEAVRTAVDELPGLKAERPVRSE